MVADAHKNKTALPTLNTVCLMHPSTQTGRQKLQIGQVSSRAPKHELPDVCGIASDTVDKIFDSFYTTKAGGMGMGLSISRSILQSHGGRLWAVGKDAPGTMFHFTVPKYREEGTHAPATGT